MSQWFWCKFGATLYRAILTIFTISHEITRWSYDITRYYTIFTISNGTLKTRRDKNIVPLAQFKTHLPRWVFVFISREQWNKSATADLWKDLSVMKYADANEMHCGAWGFILFHDAGGIISWRLCRHFMFSKVEHFILPHFSCSLRWSRFALIKKGGSTLCWAVFLRWIILAIVIDK